jgi:alcohol dehydrogenase class IV
MNMQSFQHIAPPLRLYSGDDSLRQLGRELDRLRSRRAVILCGSTLAHSPALKLVRSAMGDRCAGVFPGVRAHSSHPSVQAAAEELKRLNADAVVAVGGGSAIVTARAASIYLAEGSNLEKISTSQDAQGNLHSPKLLAPKLPQLVVPTTPTTAAVKAGTAVFDPASARRFALFDPKTRAQSLFIHPALINSAPRDLVVSASLDTLSLAIEGLTSRSGDPIADALLMHSVLLISQNLPDPALDDDATVRGEMVFAAVMCGQGTDHTGAGIATVLGHAIGANHDVDNGIAKAVVLPHALRFNAEAAEAGLRKVATSLGVMPVEGSTVEFVNDALARIFTAIGIPRRLREVGIPKDALAAIATRSMGDWFLRSNARPINDPSDLLTVLSEAW